MNKYRTHNCAELREKNIGENVKLSDGFIENVITEIYYLLI